MIQLIRSKRRTISLIINREGALVVRAPIKTSLEYINKIIEKKDAWIKKQQNKIKTRLEQNKQNKFIEKDGILFLGKRIIPTGLNLENKELVKIWYKKNTLIFMKEKLDFFTKKFGLKYNKIKITSASKRWGSCSGKGNINFSWKLIMAPQEIVEYVIIHEIAHLRHKNHSQKFWKFVEEMMPDYKKHDNWLKKNGFLLSF